MITSLLDRCGALRRAAVFLLCLASVASAAPAAAQAPEGVRFGPWWALAPLELPGASNELDGARPLDRELRDLAKGRPLDLEKAYPHKGGGRAPWVKIAVTGDETRLDVGPIDLLRVAPGATQAQAFLYRTLEVDQATDLVLALGSDDALRLWLDGEVVLNRPILRSATAFDDRLSLHLEPGSHTLLAKVTQELGGFGLRMSVPSSPSPAAIDAAIARAVGFLLEMQMVDGSWGVHEEYGGGHASLAAYALSQSGLAPDHPAIRMALEYARERQGGYTYAAACDVLALSRVGSTPEDQAWLAARSEDLVRWQDSTGLYAYPEHPVHRTARRDLSNAIFAGYALRLAAKSGFEVPGKIWTKLVKGSLDCQEDVHEIVAARGGEVKAAGFAYVPGQKPTASLTLGALALHAIAEEQLGRELSPSLRNQVQDARELGLAWLGAHFTWTQNAPPSVHHMYAIYGMERLGSLLGQETLLERPWFLDGASYLIEHQEPSGSWKFEDEELATMLGLLFLNRASASTGTSKQGLRGYTTQDEAADVRLVASGDSPLTVWIDGLSSATAARLERLPGQGPLVREVAYFVRPRGESAGSDALQPFAVVAAGDAVLGAERFPVQHSFERRGEYQVWVRLECLPAPDTQGEADGGSDGAPVFLESPPLDVTISETLLAAQLEYGKHEGQNLLLDRDYELTASSQTELEAPALAFDGSHATRWRSLASDAEPSLTLELSRAVRAGRLVLSHAQPWKAASGDPRALRVRLVVNDRTTLEVDVDPDPTLKTAIPFDKPISVKSLVLTVLDSSAPAVVAEAGPGFSEVELLP